MNSPKPLTIRPANHADLDHVVTTHLDAFPEFFLSFLGPRFLREFYRGLIDAPTGVLLMAHDESANAVAGFLGGASDESAFFSWLLADRRHVFMKEAGLAAARHPSSIPRLWRARHRDLDASSSAAQASLLTLGVAPRYRRLSLGQALVREFERDLQTRGLRAYCLTTDAEDNVATNAFYMSLGMTRVSTRTTPEGRRMAEYICHLHPQDGVE